MTSEISERAKGLVLLNKDRGTISELVQFCAVGNIKHTFRASTTPTQPDEATYMCNESLKLLMATDKPKMLAVVKNITSKLFANDPNRDKIDPQHFLTAYVNAALAGKASMSYDIGDNSYPDVPIRPAMAYSFAYAYAILNPKVEFKGKVIESDAAKSLFGNIPDGGIKQSALAGALEARGGSAKVSANDNGVVVPPTAAGYAAPAKVVGRGAN